MTQDIEPIPTTIILHKVSRTLEIVFDTHERFILSCAYLRASSPSAEARYASSKENAVDHSSINILAIEPVGQYAIRPVFSDGHRTGIYSWRLLYQLGLDQKRSRM